jgi:hypothetical protein
MNECEETVRAAYPAQEPEPEEEETQLDTETAHTIYHGNSCSGPEHGNKSPCFGV